MCAYAPFFFVLVMCPWMPVEALDVIELEFYTAIWVLKIELRFSRRAMLFSKYPLDKVHTGGHLYCAFCSLMPS